MSVFVEAIYRYIQRIETLYLSNIYKKFSILHLIFIFRVCWIGGPLLLKISKMYTGKLMYIKLFEFRVRL